MPRKQKLSPEAKVKLAQACLSGEIGVCEAGRQSGVSHESVRRWIARYESEGAEGFLPQGTNRVYYRNRTQNSHLAAVAARCL